MTINFISSKDSDETQIMYSKSDKIKIMIGSETDEIITEIFESFLQRYQEALEESTEEIIFFLSFDLLYYKLHKISPNSGGLYIDSLKWLKNKKGTIKSKK